MQYKMLHEIILKLHSSHDHRSEHCCMSTGMEQVHSRGQSTVITVDIFKPDITFCADQCIVAGQQVWSKFIHEVNLR